MATTADNTAPITLTERAAARVRRHLEQRGAGYGLRLGVKRTGCSGWSYLLDYADAAGAGDRVFEDQGIRVVVDGSQLDVLAGTRIDYVRVGLNEQFLFENPNAGESCGCGESFTLRS